ncbi:hypothetical protein [Salibacterium qingdaonense]|uniref:Uncharacterized protein n=1 Tax=Salibacterium qingdaonense TaxID=266892 RepID=A0A1I4I4U7_9BACI|nr:hypothetical protein [Salibacterium qingdaonense]SFL49345.1 hypothetical protein SAMN04488054_101221 [Salibacterium qingdaonense]
MLKHVKSILHTCAIIALYAAAGYLFYQMLEKGWYPGGFIKEIEKDKGVTFQREWFDSRTLYIPENAAAETDRKAFAMDGSMSRYKTYIVIAGLMLYLTWKALWSTMKYKCKRAVIDRNTELLKGITAFAVFVTFSVLAIYQYTEINQQWHTVKELVEEENTDI